MRALLAPAALAALGFVAGSLIGYSSMSALRTYSDRVEHTLQAAHALALPSPSAPSQVQLRGIIESADAAAGTLTMRAADPLDPSRELRVRVAAVPDALTGGATPAYIGEPIQSMNSGDAVYVNVLRSEGPLYMVYARAVR